MGDFSSKEFDWHARAAFFRPDLTEIKQPCSDESRPGEPPKLPSSMGSDELKYTEYFKAALFELVMRRAEATMLMAEQDSVKSESERFAVAKLEIHFDTNMFVAHTEDYNGSNPVGFNFIREMYSDKFTAFSNLAIRTMVEWSDSAESFETAKNLNLATLSCNTGGIYD